ncbi:MAG: hypothetical protein AB4050_11185 [Synechococcus sp.]
MSASSVGLRLSASTAVFALSLLLGGGAYAQSSRDDSSAVAQGQVADTQGQVEVEVGRLDRWLENSEAAELESNLGESGEGGASTEDNSNSNAGSAVSRSDRLQEQDSSGFYEDSDSSDSAFGNQPTFELDIGVQQGPSDGAGSGGLSGDDSGSNRDSDPNDASAGDGSGTDREGVGQDGSGPRNGSGSGSPSGAGDGSTIGDGGGTGESGQGAPGGEGPVQTRRDYIPQITGLIVDARQLDFLPSMSMRLFDPDGNQVYTTPSTNRQLNASQVAVNGTALFVTDEAQARELVNRIGERPHTIAAQRTQGYDLVISNQDAWALRNQNERDRFLENYAVVVIWQPRN